MKVTFFFLVLFSLVSALAATTESPNPVRDTYGDILRAGTNYYILPAVHGRGGGVTLATLGWNPCPLDVVQEEQALSHGLPVTFSPVNIKKGVIRLHTDLNIMFSTFPRCGVSTVWTVDGFDYWKPRYVKTGGVEGNPGKQTVTNWFKIEKDGDDKYKLVYCPTVCEDCGVICKNVGIVVDNGVRRLALSDEPFKVKFLKA